MRTVTYRGLLRRLLRLVCDAEFIQEHPDSKGGPDEQSLSLSCEFSMKWAEMAVQPPVMTLHSIKATAQALHYVSS